MLPKRSNKATPTQDANEINQYICKQDLRVTDGHKPNIFYGSDFSLRLIFTSNKIGIKSAHLKFA